MKIKTTRLGHLLLLAVGLFALSACSSSRTSLPPATPVADIILPAAAEPNAPVFIGSGTVAAVATGLATVMTIDYTNRTCLLLFPDGQTINFKAGPEYVNFDQLKFGDTFMTTISKSFVAYLVKSGVTPGSITNSVVQSRPAGSLPGGVMIRNVDYHATVMDVNTTSRGVVLHYGVGEAKYVVAGPGVNLSLIHVNDNVFIHTTEAVAISVVPR